jgi:hypothetical protein
MLFKLLLTYLQRLGHFFGKKNFIFIAFRSNHKKRITIFCKGIRIIFFDLIILVNEIGGIGKSLSVQFEGGAHVFEPVINKVSIVIVKS